MVNILETNPKIKTERTVKPTTLSKRTARGNEMVSKNVQTTQSTTESILLPTEPEPVKKTVDVVMKTKTGSKETKKST